MPILAEKVFDFSRWREESIGNLEQPNSTAPCAPPQLFMAATCRSPNKFARFARTVAIHQGAFEHVGLLNQHVLMVGDFRTGLQPLSMLNRPDVGSTNSVLASIPGRSRSLI